MKKYYFLFSEGSKINQIICALLINLPVFAYGACIGWISPMTLLLQSKDSPTGEPLSDSVVSWMVAAAYITCVPLDFFMAYLSDKIGRKTTLLIISASCGILWIIKLSSMDTWAFVLARAMVGFSMAGCYVTCPLYTKEISEDSVRGLLGSIMIFFHTTGNLFTYIIGDMLPYHMVLWVCLAFPTVHIMLFLMMPESPSYLVKVGKHEEAARVIGWLRCRSEDDSVVQRELDLIKKEFQNDEGKSKFLFKEIFTNRILFRAFRIAILVSLARELCGAITVLNFAGEIFSLSSEGTGLVLTPNQQAMMLGAIQVVGSALASSVVEKAGRKPLLFITSLLSGVSMCGLASWFLVRDYGVAAPSWIPITTLCLCIFCDSSGMLPISVVIISEIFSFKYRGEVMAIAMAVATVTDILQVLFFKPLVKYVGIHIAFYFFGIICLVMAAYVIIALPETKKRSLEEIYQKLKTKKEREEEIKPIKEISA